MGLNNLLEQLQKVEKLASAGKLTRLLHDPVRYIQSQTLLKLIYPRTHKGVIKKTTTFFGADMDVLLPAATDIYLTGGKTHDSEIRLAKFMIRQLKLGQTYIDIGAHFGYFSLLAATIVGNNGRVYAFEASKNTHAILATNAGRLRNIEVLHNAVSDSEGELKFYEFPVLYSEYNSMNIEQFNNEQWINKYQPVETRVKAVSIDGFIGNTVKPDVIKIDVEGAEDKVIAGSVSTLTRYVPVIVMEFLSEDRLNIAHAKALEQLNLLGYQPHVIQMDGTLAETSDVKEYLRTNNIDSDNIVFLKK